MAPAIFPDNTVLCNFAAVGRLDLLRDWLRGRGRWTDAVAREAEQSARVLPALQGVRDEGWLGAPIEVLDAAEQRRIESIRRIVFGGEPNPASKHLGEAETCFLIRERAEFREAWWISDDEDAYEYACGQRIHALRTIDVMRGIIVDCDLTAAGAFELMNAMADHDRGLVLPASPRDLM